MQSFNTLTIYRSSAGSGKTYTLVKEYLKLALAHPQSFHQILAITFTNKATDEMKSRIVKTLVEFAEVKSENLSGELQSELKFTNEKFNLHTNVLLGNILHNYSNFAVSTIDSFFHKVIRSLAKEMGLPLKFDTELNQETVISEITARLMLDAGRNLQLTRWLEDFILSKMNENKGWNIESELHLIAKELFKEDFRTVHKPEENITNDFVKELRAIKHSFESTMKAFGTDFLNTIREDNLEITDFAHGKSGVAGYLEKISKKILPKEYEPSKRSLESNENPEKWCTKTSQKKDQVLALVENKLRYILEDVIKYYDKYFEGYMTANEVLNLIYIAGIINKLDEKLKEYRDENDLLLISDTNLLLKDFISGADAPFIYEKTGNRYHHFMIDEFQDTSAFQWSNLLPLIENSLAAGSSAMMVGDAKQSIYRWRGGKMQLLLTGIQNDLKHYESITGIQNLKTNFRSKKKIVDFNNSFFCIAPSCLPLPEISDEDKKDLTRAYHMDEVEQKTFDKNNEGGYVEFTFYNKEENNENENEEELSTDKIALKRLLLTLGKLREQGFEMKDICILVRKNLHGNEIAKFLFENGYKKIVSSESLLISKAPQIVFLINVLKILKNADDKIARAECLNYYLTQIEQSKNKSGHEIFSMVNDTNLFFKTLPSDFSNHILRLRKLPLYELSEQLTGIFKLNKKPDAYIQRFQDLVMEYLDKNLPSLSSFLDWWEENNESDKCSVIVPANENAIQIVTIHKAKGLQFPVVIMPFPEWDLKPKSDILWVHSDKKPYSDYSLLPIKITQALTKSFFKNAYKREVQQTLIDNLNLLYVAFTRAKERLYVFCPQKKTEKINSTAQLICKVVESNDNWKNNIVTFNGTRKFSSGVESALTGEYASKEVLATSFENPEVISLGKYTSNPWQNKLVLAVNKNKISVYDENPADDKSDFNRLPVREGLLIHHFLSKIILESDAEKVIPELLQSGLISSNQKEGLEKTIHEVLKLCKPYKWFTGEWKIKAEAEIILTDGSVIRPDRVMIKNKNVVLLDFKTGEENPMHGKQLNAYKKILLDAGYGNVEKYLLYIKTMKLLKV